MIAPYEKDLRNTPHGPTEDLRIELTGLARDAGLFAPQVPERWGGIGLDHVNMAIGCKACGLSPLGPIAMHCAAPDEGNMNLFDKVASEAQKQRWLKPFAAGDFRSCVSMTEPLSAGSHPSKMKTTARYDGDEFVVNGGKWLITGAKGAGFTTIFCDVEPDGDKPGGPTC
ncbi:acyl-CoA dehydrogenase family protein [Salipiger sp. 1_MG-2023]|uniref:acyl-CoA dehydrogenase family protein n=1 Tax=Salipiger sp. 1_MG-2023 TaxID=3062665 RepID=UPI0026E253DB|nr:acyl-CoA dehydrogenase family protein [Salipiger sp. 1_MG-2023]MDO6588170.1 acyl-CoA dehydrogenase family protein [Salipiger sp. 1_MG-2023]